MQISFHEISGDDGEWPEARPAAPKRRLSILVRAELERVKEVGLTRGYRPSTMVGEVDHMTSILGVAADLFGRDFSVLDIGRQPELLAQACISSSRRDGCGELRRTTLLRRCSTAKNVLSLLESEIGIRCEETIERFEATINDHCDLLGDQYAFRAGRTDKRPKYTPSPAEVSALLKEASTHQGPIEAARDVAFIAQAAILGLRLSEGIIPGSAYFFLGDSLHIRIMPKTEREQGQFRIPPELRIALERYVEADKWLAQFTGADTVGFGTAGSFWRTARHEPFTRQAALAMIRRSSARAFRETGSHALRRFATWEFAACNPSDIVWDAIGWKGAAIPSRFYCPPLGYFISQDRDPPTAEPEADVAGA